MNRLMIVGGVALAVTCGFAEGEKSEPTTAEIAAQEAVEKSLLDDDGVSIVTAPDGSFTIFSRGTGTYQFAHPKAELEARKVARLNAEKQYAKFITTAVMGSDGVDEMSKNSLVLDGDGKVQNQHSSMESLEPVKSTIASNFKAVLSGLVVLESKKIATPGTTGGVVQMTMVYSSKTAKVALSLGKKLQDHQAELRINEAKNEARVNAVRQFAQNPGPCAGQTVKDGGCCPPSAATPVNKSEIRVNKTEY